MILPIGEPYVLRAAGAPAAVVTLVAHPLQSRDELVIGTVALAEDSAVKGFLCEESALTGAREITEFGGWRSYRNSLAS